MISEFHQSSDMLEDGREVLSFCPACKNAANPLDAHILGEKNDARLVHLACQKCARTILALVTVSNAGVSSVSLLTDLTFEDVIRFKESEAITTDHVIALHDQLNGSGSWCERFAQNG